MVLRLTTLVSSFNPKDEIMIELILIVFNFYLPTVNYAPEISNTSVVIHVTKGQSGTYGQFTAVDRNGDPITWGITNTASGFNIVNATGVLTMTNIQEMTSADFAIIAQDNKGGRGVHTPAIKFCKCEVG